MPTWRSPNPKPLSDGGERVRVVGFATEGVDASPEDVQVVRGHVVADPGKVALRFPGGVGEAGVECRGEPAAGDVIGELRAETQGAEDRGDVGLADEPPDRLVGLPGTPCDVMGLLG